MKNTALLTLILCLIVSLMVIEKAVRDEKKSNMRRR